MKEIDVMKWERIGRLTLLIFLLATFGCAEINSYQSDAPGTPEMMGCNGDRATGVPPYCHPGP